MQSSLELSPLIVTHHNSADSIPMSNLVCDKEVAIRTSLSYMINIATWCPWSWGRASALQSWDPKFESREWVSTLGFFIGPHIRREYWCSSQEAESREISISCKNLFLSRCKINMFKLKYCYDSLLHLQLSYWHSIYSLYKCLQESF